MSSKPADKSNRDLRATASPIVPATEPIDEREIARRTRRSFVGAAIAGAAGLAAWQWLRTRPESDGQPWPLRKTLEVNEKIAGKLVSDQHRQPELPFGSAPKNPRVNGDLGLTSDIDLAAWRLNLEGLAAGDGTGSLSVDAVKDFEPVNVAMRLCCIEGWSVAVNWTGTRFRDFAARYAPASGTSGKPRKYVSMTTPDGDYFVGLDMASVLHPQTLLCYAIDDQPLTPEHGAPLRLVIPSKYGVKNIKRIGTISYTDQKPADYWTQQGYDWFAGL